MNNRNKTREKGPDLNQVRIEVQTAFEKYIEAYFTLRDADKTFAMFGEEMTVIGSGPDEIAFDMGQVKTLYLRDLSQAPTPVEVNCHRLNVEVLSASTGLVTAVVSIKTNIEDNPIEADGLRISAIFRQIGNDWFIIHKHISLPTNDYENGESYPIEELKKRNQWLEEKINEKTQALEATNKKLQLDIAKRRETEIRLQISEVQKNAILNGISSNIAFVDKDLKIIWANKTAAKSVKKTPDEMIGHTCYHFWADPSQPCKNCPSLKALDTKKSEQTIMHTPDGRVWEERGEPVFDDKGNIIGVVEIATDITERARMEDVLRESEEKYKLLYNNVADSIFIHDAFGKILSVNQSACLEYEFSYNEFMLLKVHQIDAPEHSIYATERTSKLMKDGFIQFETIHQRKDRSILDVEVNSRKIVFNGQDAVISICRNITERKQAEDALLNSEAIHSAMISNISDVIGIIGTDGIMKYKSPNIEKWFGWQPHDLIGTDGWLTVHPGDLEHIQKEFFTLLEKDNSVKTVEYRYKCKNGSYKPIELTATNLTNDPIIGGVLLNYHDISLRKHADDLLQQTRQNYETFFNTIDEFLFVLDEQGNIIHTNTTVIDRLGYTREELAGLSVLMVHPPERRDEAARIVGEMLTGVSEFCPVPIVTKSGIQIPVETRVSHGFWDGKPAIFGVTKDISKVRLSEEKFSKLFHLNPSPCGLSDLDTRQYIEVNEAFYALLGFDKNEVIGKSATDLGILTPETINAILLKADSNGNVTNAEADLIAKNGDKKQVLLSAENIHVQDKKYRFTVVHDITARRQFENQLKESEYLQRSLLENVAVGIMIIDPETRVIERINTFALSLIGESAENIIGRRCHQFICPAQEQSCPVCDKGQVVDNSERVLLRADKTTIPVLKTVKRIEIGGREKLLESFVDISTQKKAEENLLQSSQKFEAIISASPDGIGMVSLDGKVQLMSNKLLTMYGYTIEEANELLGRGIFDFIDPINHKMLMDNIGKLLAGEKGNKVTEYLAVKKDQSRFYVDINSTLLPDSNGNPESILFVERDITERKLSEEVLFKSEEKFRTVADNTYDWEYWEGKDKQIIYISPSCERISGYKPEEFLSNRFLLKKIIHPADAKLFDDHFEKTHSIEHMRDIEELDFRIINKDGSVAHIGHLCRPVFDDKDNCLGRRISNRDITERKQIEQALWESEDTSRTYIENSFDVIFTLNIKGEFLLVSKAWERHFGHPVNDVIGKPFALFVHPDDVAPLSKYLMQVLSAGKSGTSPAFRVKRTDGAWRWFLANGAPYVNQKGEHQFIGVGHDITESKQAEQALHESEESLRNMNAEKDKFFSIIAHDMRSPFNAFLGFTRIMVEELNTMSLEEIRTIVVSMRKSATNLYSLLENLLEWSMMQQGAINFCPVSFPLSLKIKESIALIIGSVQKKEIEINYDIPDDLSAFADVHMVESLIRNLISNAVKFTPKKGKITVSANKIEGNFIEIAVRDAGIGMKKELMSNLFRLDEQTGRIGTEGEPSSGLGLIICNDFVEKHGGKIWVESEEGKGSTFYFTIPYKTEKHAQSSDTIVVPIAFAPAQIKNLKILIAEDDETSDSFITSMLKINSHEILHAKTGIEAVDTCRNNTDIDLVLMDIRMPGMNGYEVTRQIRQFNTGVIIIAQTAYGLSGDRQKAIDAGCNDYLSKPIDKDELLGLIQKYFKNNI